VPRPRSHPKPDTHTATALGNPTTQHAGAKNGEKKLRSLLCRTAQWSNADAREATAVRADANGMPDMASALRGRDSSALRKRHFFALCRDWGYRSDVWRHMREAHAGGGASAVVGGGGAETRAASAHARAAPCGGAPESNGAAAPLALYSRPPACPQARALLLVICELMPHVTVFSALIATPSLRAAACAEPCAPIATLSTATMAAGRDLGRSMCAALEAEAGVLHASRVAVVASGDGDAPAWRLGARAPPHAENSVHKLLLLTHALVAASADIEARLPLVVGRRLSAPELAHARDHLAACGALHAFVSRAQGILASLRTDGGAAAYLHAGTAVVEAVGDIMSAAERSNEERLLAFSARAAAAPRAWCHTFFEHAVEVGAMPSVPSALRGDVGRAAAL
jgi:hypothetical protein